MSANVPTHWARASPLVRALAAASFVLLSCTARAACIPSTDSRLRHFDTIMRANPEVAEQQIEKQLAVSANAEASYRASLYVLLAEAYSIQEKHDDAHRAVREGLELVNDHQSPLYINLLFFDAARTLEEGEVAPAIRRADAALKAQPAGSAGEACALTTLGLLEYIADRTDLASIYLTRAYRMSAGPERRQQRMTAAAVLSIVMQALRDFPAALALSQDVIDWQAERNSIFELSTSYFMHGFILTELGDRVAARAALERSRALSLKFKDAVGVAYADLLLCANETGLGKTREARGYCEAALHAFTEAAANEPRKQALTWLAEINLRENKPSRALAILDQVLDSNGSDLPPFRLAQIFELRARARRELGDYRAALEDYDNYMRRFKANKEDERARDATAIRARFETDREIERNEFLQRELKNQSERLAAQSARLHWMIATAAAATGGLVLLTCLLLANRKKKRLLARLAQADELTGLPNRRYTLKRATEAFESRRRKGALLTIGILDLDHFKRINDRFGHAAGDYVLKEFARISRETIRGVDILGRWGGEEFLIVLPDTPLDEALEVVERVRKAAATIAGGPLPTDFTVSVSAGLATREISTRTLEEIIAQADVALYNAKHRGRNLVQVAQESFDASATGIRRSLKDAGIDLKTGKFALAR